jgi:formiminotetrahydrofolate cyclodeaminase
VALDADKLAAESAGVAAAGAAAAAARLVEMAARASEAWPDAQAMAGQAQMLRRRAEELADENARTYATVLRALEQRGSSNLGGKLERAAETPLRIAEVANDIALLAREVAGRCERRVSADALAAASLAAGAAGAAAELVASNLTALEGDERVARANALAASARRSAGAGMR